MNEISTSIFQLNTFNSSEAEAMTGLTATQQRDWRRRGLLPSMEGHARYTLVDLAIIKSLKQMSDAAIPQYLREELAPICARGIVHNVLEHVVDFPISRIYEGDWQAWFDQPFKRHSALMPDGSDFVKKSDYYKHEGLKARSEGDFETLAYWSGQDISDYVVTELKFARTFGHDGGRWERPKDMLIITGGTSPYWVWPREFAEELSSSDPVRRALEDSAGVMIHLGEMARGLARKTPRPFVKLTYSEGGDA